MQSTMSHSETIVMSVGGSLIVPDAIDTGFLTNLKNFIVTETAKGRRFIIIAGGGRTARRYQDAAGVVSELNSDDLDWMGIHATRLMDTSFVLSFAISPTASLSPIPTKF